MPAPLIHALRLLVLGIQVNRLAPPPPKHPGQDLPKDIAGLIDHYYDNKRRQRP